MEKEVDWNTEYAQFSVGLNCMEINLNDSFFNITVDEKLSQMFGFTGQFIAMDEWWMEDGNRIFMWIHPFFDSLETGSSGGIFLSQKWELGMIVFHDQVVEAVCAGRCLGRVVCGQKGTKSLDFFRKNSTNRTQEHVHTLMGIGAGMKLIRTNGAQEKINS